MLIRPADRSDDAALDALLPPRAGAGAVRRLRTSGELVGALCLVAEVQGAVVAHVPVARTQPDGLVWLGDVTVREPARGRGVGTALVHSVVAAAEALWFVGVVTTGSPERMDRWGFVDAGPHGLVSPATTPRSPLLVRPLPSSWPGGFPPGTLVQDPFGR